MIKYQDLQVEEYEIKAELINGNIIKLEKDCECLIHDGPHWYYMNLLERKINTDAIKGLIQEQSPSLLHFTKDNSPEIIRLNFLKQKFIDLSIKRIILPFGSNNYDLYIKESFKANSKKLTNNKCDCGDGRDSNPNNYFEICKKCNGTGYKK